VGIDVRIQDERGGVIKELLDPRSLVSALLPSEANGSVCLRLVDKYGDTYFNQMQVPILITELRAAVRACSDAAAKAHGEAVVALVEGAQDSMHTYVRFVGD
jgi:hypothetical protein